MLYSEICPSALAPACASTVNNTVTLAANVQLCEVNKMTQANLSSRYSSDTWRLSSDKEVVTRNNSIKQGQNEAFLNDFHVKESKGFQRKMTKAFAFTRHLYDMLVISDVWEKDWKARCDGAHLSSQHLRTDCKKIAQVRDQPELCSKTVSKTS